MQSFSLFSVFWSLHILLYRVSFLDYVIYIEIKLIIFQSTAMWYSLTVVFIHVLWLNTYYNCNVYNVMNTHCISNLILNAIKLLNVPVLSTQFPLFWSVHCHNLLSVVVLETLTLTLTCINTVNKPRFVCVTFTHLSAGIQVTFLYYAIISQLPKCAQNYKFDTCIVSPCNSSPCLCRLQRHIFVTIYNKRLQSMIAHCMCALVLNYGICSGSEHMIPT